MEHDSPDATLMFKAGSDAALGDFMIEVIGHTASSGPDFVKEFGYGMARLMRRSWVSQGAADTLQITLNGEGHANQKPTGMAERKINFLALDAIG